MGVNRSLDLDRPWISTRKNIWVKLGTWFATARGRVINAEDLPADETFDVAIAIGIGVNESGTGPSPRSLANVREAYRLWRNKQIKNIILSGGNGTENSLARGLSEASAMSLPLLEREVPAHAFYLEHQSTNTVENAQFALMLMHRHNWRSAVIIAEAIHSGRVAAVFEKQWAGTSIRLRTVRTFGEYGESAGRFTTPLPFLLYNTAASIYSKLKGWS